MEVYTIGHSTHTQEAFLKLLNDAEITQLIDVRAFPGSCKFPHFHQNQMKRWLPEHDIGYTHVAALGGRRTKSNIINPERNAGWINQSFHNYADYTLTPEFEAGIEQLEQAASKQRIAICCAERHPSKRIAICCAERHPSRCHRLLISNWLVAHNWEVRHILDGPKDEILIINHELRKWGAEPVLQHNGQVIYPPKIN